MKSKRTAPKPLALVDYQRMAQVISTVMRTVEYDVTKSCTFFSIIGAYLLKSRHGLKARPVAGAAAYRVNDETGAVISYGIPSFEEDCLRAEGNNFHCWIECEGYIVDLMAPFFREVLNGGGEPQNIPRWMFQKPTQLGNDSLFSLEKAGDFYLAPDASLTARILTTFQSYDKNLDLVEVCNAWYLASPKAMSPKMGIMSERGEVREMQLKPLTLTGAW